MLPFMKLSDIRLFIRSARSDARLREWWPNSDAGAVFDRLYATAPESDPWASITPRFSYQRLKYDMVASLIPRGRYRRALDLGCGAGLFSERLVGRADEVVGIDISAVAVEIARTRAWQMPNIHFTQGDLRDLPATLDGSFDLITILDALYYLPPPIDTATLKALAVRLARLASADGVLVLVNHYVLGFDADFRLSGRIHEAFRWSPAWVPVAEYRRPFYVVSVLRSQG